MPRSNKPLRVALPFDPNPRAPSWRLPAGACDTHFHVFGPPNLFPYAENRRYEPPAGPIEHYFAMQKAVGLERGVVVQPTAHGTDNSALLDAIARSDGRLKGVANIDETMSDAELEKLKAGGIVGARFSLMSDRPGTRRAIEAAVPRLMALGWSLDLHIEPEHLVENAAFVKSLPLTTVIDHMARPHVAEGSGQPAFRLLLDLLGEGRFWTKLSAPEKLSAEKAPSPPDGVPYKDVVPFGRAVIAAAPSRIIWGSDWPHGNTFEMGTIPNDGALLDFLAACAQDEEARRRVLVDNPAQLYGFTPR
ncbi:MAG: amidohydrolase [Hyphomicrobiaceae bacterium]